MARHILAALDLTTHSKAVFQAAVELAKLHNATLTLCHIKTHTPVVMPIEHGVFIPMAPPAVALSTHATQALERFQKEAKACGIKTVETVHTFSATPGLAIADVIAPGYDVDLVVCGASSRSGIDRLFLGSVSETLVKHAPCSVFLVK